MTAAFYPIEITKGDDFSLTFSVNIKNCDTNEQTPVDYSAATFEAKLLDLSNNELVPFSTSYDNTNSEITISLNTTQTSALVGLTAKPREKIGSFYVRITSAGVTETKLRGTASLLSVEGL